MFVSISLKGFGGAAVDGISRSMHNTYPWRNISVVKCADECTLPTVVEGFRPNTTRRKFGNAGGYLLRDDSQSPPLKHGANHTSSARTKSCKPANRISPNAAYNAIGHQTNVRAHVLWTERNAVRTKSGTVCDR